MEYVEKAHCSKIEERRLVINCLETKVLKGATRFVWGIFHAPIVITVLVVRRLDCLVYLRISLSIAVLFRNEGTPFKSSTFRLRCVVAAYVIC